MGNIDEEMEALTAHEAEKHGLNPKVLTALVMGGIAFPRLAQINESSAMLFADALKILLYELAADKAELYAEVSERLFNEAMRRCLALQQTETAVGVVVSIN